MTEALSVEADLDVTVDGRRCAVWTEDGVVVVNAPSLATARELLAGVDALPVSQRRVAGELADATVTAEVRVRHAPVARLGSGVDPSPLAELAGYEAALSSRGVLVAAWRWLG
ncbi:MAG: hypothetical protein V5A44_07095 [Haloarculaceae archaeon]